jgi:hypothetical protein
MKMLGTLLLTVSIGLFGTDTHAQGHPLGPVQQQDLSLLLTLPGEEVIVRYTHGSLDRAARLQFRLTDLQRQLAKWTKVRTPFVVYVLSPEEWNGQGLFRPYGFPVRTASMTIAVPGWGDEASVALWREITGTTMPGAGGDFAARGTAEELATLTLADGFAQLEFCRMFVERHRLAGGPEGPWLNEILAHLLLLQHTQTSKLPPTVDLTAVLQSASRGHAFAPLEHYEGQMELEEWLAHHARFAAAAEQIWATNRKKAFKELWRLRRKQGTPLTFQTLAGEYPFLVDWRQTQAGVR